jgi:xyloglucan-specific exo-beta-1,4-glucanase
LKWDTVHNVTVKSMATGIEETAVLGLISPPGGPPLLSVTGDIGGFYHVNLDVAPDQPFTGPTYGTTLDIDYAGNKPANIVRAGGSETLPQVALSSNFGASWSANYAAPLSLKAGKVAISADADTIFMVSASDGPVVSKNSGAFTAVSSLPLSSVITSDKRNNTVFYGGSAGG